MDTNETMVARSYRVTSPAEQRALYDDWAVSYEKDLCGMGVRSPFMISAVFAHFVPLSTAPILDVGCGTGLQAEALGLLGYGPIIGIDISEQMLNAACTKGIYRELHRMTLGETLDFADERFNAVLCSGVLTPGHAPPSSFTELERVMRPGAPMVFALREDSGQLPGYHEVVAELERAGAWSKVFSSGKYHSMPFGEPEVVQRVHVYRKA